MKIKETLLYRGLRKILRLIKCIPETIRFLFSKDKILLNVWMQLHNNQVEHFNFGDELNYYLAKGLSNKPLFNLSNILIRREENLMAIGSIVESHTNKHSIIWGSGAMFGGEKKIPAKPKKILAVRGPLTREYLLSQGIDCPEVYGDPALLLPLIYKPQTTKKYTLGIIPHYVDYESEYLNEIKHDTEVKIINFQNYNNWQHIIDEISECEFIASSSLHGLIVSDAYGIPNVWIKLSDNISGGMFKFHDYFSAVGRELVAPIVISSSVKKEHLLMYKEKYSPITFDADKLLNVCPFYEKPQH